MAVKDKVLRRSRALIVASLLLSLVALYVLYLGLILMAMLVAFRLPTDWPLVPESTASLVMILVIPLLIGVGFLVAGWPRRHDLDSKDDKGPS